jgi:energy-coupling factor transporter ATP-binding protein EcfA2
MSITKITIIRQYLWTAQIVVLVRVAFAFVFGDHSVQVLENAFFEGGKLALWVLAFGSLNLIFDLRKALRYSPKFLRNLTTPLGIAISLTPELAGSLIRVKAASKLRANRKGFGLVKSTLIPVLTNAVDQSLNLADSMDSRGFGGKPTQASGPIKLADLTFGYSPETQVLNNASVNLPEGSLTLISGDTGSGKSTLLKVIQAKHPGCALVGQFPRQSFVADIVADEIAFTLIQAGLGKAEIRARVGELAAQFSLDLSARTMELSAGWQQRLSIAAALASSSRILLLDEPLSALDEPSTELVLETLSKLKDDGYTIVVAEHRVAQVAQIADQTLTLSDGQIKHTNLKPTPLKPRPSELTRVIVGNNGSGKTTYLNGLATSTGVLVPQPASDLLFLESVADECRQADLDCGKSLGTTAKTLKRLSPQIMGSQNPRDLSEGQKVALAIAIQLSRDTKLLMLDEPTLGMDTKSRQVLVELIGDLADSGVEVLAATHDHEFASAISNEMIPIGELVNNATH